MQTHGIYKYNQVPFFWERKQPCYFFQRGLKEVSAVKHKHIQDSLMKNLTQKCFYHLVTGTEDGFNFDKCIYSIVNQFYFLKGV